LSFFPSKKKEQAEVGQALLYAPVARFRGIGRILREFFDRLKVQPGPIKDISKEFSFNELYGYGKSERDKTYQGHG
jgi:hypothetical protein